MKTLRTFCAALLFSVTGLLTQTALAAETVEGPKVAWNYAAWGNPNAAQWTIIRNLSTFLDERTDGQFKMNIHYGQLAKPNAILDGIQVGAFQGGTILSAYYPGKLTATSGLDLPFLPIHSMEQFAEVTDAYMTLEPVKAEFDRSNAQYYMSILVPLFEVIGKGDAPQELADWQGLRLRLLGTHGEAMEKIGAVARPMPGARTYGAMDRGELDGVTMPHTAFLSYNLQEVGDWYTSNLRLGTANAVMAFNKDAYAALPDQYKALMDEYRSLGYHEQITEIATEEAEAPATYAAAGLTDVVLSDAQIEELRSVAAHPVWDSWAETTTSRKVNGEELLNTILSLLEESKDAGS